MIDEQQIFEAHGVFAGKGDPKGWADAKEVGPDEVGVGVRGFTLRMNADSALRLASLLRRCANRAKTRVK